jgi:5-methylcytosine-specific restriction endonuclease McrA
MFRRNRARLLAMRLPCWLCGEPIDYDAPAGSPDAFEADHAIPLAHGGSDVLGNLRPAHHRCNRGRRLPYRVESRAALAAQARRSQQAAAEFRKWGL